MQDFRVPKVTPMPSHPGSRLAEPPDPAPGPQRPPAARSHHPRHGQPPSVAEPATPGPRGGEGRGFHARPGVAVAGMISPGPRHRRRDRLRHLVGCVLQHPRGQVGVPHCHRWIGMPEYGLRLEERAAGLDQ